MGELGLPKTEGIVEPTISNYMLVSSVLQLVVQILRTDKVIHVKTLPSKNEPREDSDSEEEE